MEVFDHRHLFSTVTCQLYGQVEEVSIAALDLIWKPTGGLIRFVFVYTRLGPLVLMCSDLQQDPIEALQLYSARVRVEVMFVTHGGCSLPPKLVIELDLGTFDR